MRPATPRQVLLACTVGNGVGMTPMVYTVFGLFLLPIAGEFHWPRSTVSLVLLIVAIAGAIGFPIVGRGIDRYGSRVVILWAGRLRHGSRRRGADRR